jgi:hypothetical protein
MQFLLVTFLSSPFFWCNSKQKFRGAATAHVGVATTESKVDEQPLKYLGICMHPQLKHGGRGGRKSDQCGCISMLRVVFKALSSQPRL